MSRKASGFRAWLIQRISAIYLAVYFIYLFIHFSMSPPTEYAQWRAWLADPFISISMMLFFLALLMHAWIGVRDVVIDYVHRLPLRLTVLTAIAILLVGCGFMVMRTLILVAL
jgi:succinate dehydrogenase / fumarate reductase membrane anchor subunit